MASSSSSSNPPCAGCKFLRRKCLPGCTFAPYFSPHEPTKFFNVHKIFGASNVSKLLNEIPPHQRQDAVNSLAYEAEARLKDPVYGCVGAISALQCQVLKLQKELDATNADLRRYAGSEFTLNFADDEQSLIVGSTTGQVNSGFSDHQTYGFCQWSGDEVSGDMMLAGTPGGGRSRRIV